MNAKPKFIGYIRASTAEQQLTLVAQERELREEYERVYAATHEWGGLYIDSGISGSIPLSERPNGLRAVAALSRGDVFAVTKVDRAFRSVADMAKTFDTFDKAGVRIYVSGLKMDTGTPIAKFIMGILGQFAQFEREMIRARTVEGLRARREQGKSVGKDAPYGKSKVRRKGDNYLVENQEERAFGQLVLRLYQQGYRHRDINRYLQKHKIPHPRTGLFYFRPGQIKKWVEKELQLQAQERAAQANQLPPPEQHTPHPSPQQE